MMKEDKKDYVLFKNLTVLPIKKKTDRPVVDEDGDKKNAYKVRMPGGKDNKKHLTFRQVAWTIIENDGYVMKTAIALGVSYKTLMRFISKQPKLKDLLQDSTEALLDLAENKLRELILVGDKTAIIFHLKCKGAHRGWREDATSTPFTNEAPPVFKYEVVIPKGFKLVKEDELTPMLEEQTAQGHNVNV